VSRLVFVDTETTGLQPWHNEVWEIAVIDRKVIEHTDQPPQVVDTEHVFHIKPDLTKADATALRINRFYERTKPLDEHTAAQSRAGGHPIPGQGWDTATTAALTVARLLDGAHIVGAVPSFDAAFLGRFLHKFGQIATWHYHLIDVEALAVGRLLAETLGPLYDPHLTALPWDSDEISRALKVDVDPAARHTALGDARWARDLYDAVVRTTNTTSSHASVMAASTPATRQEIS
jgi:DNA polymerase III epsilon subunit-like protein